MKYYTIPPPPSLSHFVRFFWVLESDDAGYIHRSMAQVCTEMIFHYNGIFDELLDDNRSEQSFAAGIQPQCDRIRRFSIRRQFGIFGVYLYPYTLPLVCRTTATELTNHMLDIDIIFGKEGKELREKMLLAKSNQHRVHIIAGFLLEKLKDHRIQQNGIATAIRFVMESNGRLKVEDLADRFAMSERHFERKFKELAGFTPKRFSRIARFQAVMNNYGNPGKSLLDIAHECGYYDQSHFIHEFKQFSGHHPKAYFHKHAEGTEWRA